MQLRDKLKQLCRKRYQDLTLPGIGSVRIQSFSEFDRSSILLASGGDLVRQHTLMISRAWVDPDKENCRIFSDDEEDLKQIGEIDSAVSIPLVEAFSAHCMTIPTLEEAKKN